MGGWYAEHVAGTGRAPALWLLVGFAVAFALTRTVTRRIRAARERPVPPGGRRRQVLRDVSIGGVHVHHQVWGMVLLLVTGMLQFRYAPGTPWTEVLALLFGVGALRLARPTSPWARRRDDAARLERSRRRFDRYDARVERVRDLVGGRPT